MYKVFAVLLFILLLPGCTKTSNILNKALPIYSSFNNNAIYTAPGDFNGDGKAERMFITKPNDSYYITVLYKNNILYKKLNYSADNLKLNVQDINNDNREEIILNVIQNNCENCYVYMVDSKINTILSPEIVKSIVDSKKIADYIAFECGSYGLSEISDEQPTLKFYYTEMDYSSDESAFISEGSVYSKNANIFNIHTIMVIDKDNNIILKKMSLLPVNN